MTMKEFAETMNRAVEIYDGEILECRNGMGDDVLYIQLLQKDFDSLPLSVTSAYPYSNPKCEGDWHVEKRVDNIAFYIYHRGEYKEVA